MSYKKKKDQFTRNEMSLSTPTPPAEPREKPNEPRQSEPMPHIGVIPPIPQPSGEQIFSPPEVESTPDTRVALKENSHTAQDKFELGSQITQAKAKAQSRAPAKIDEAEGYVQLVVFGLAGELYGLDIERVESIIKMQNITVIPGANPYVQGVTNLRGAILPVINLRQRFGLVKEENLTDPRIVVVLIHTEKVGLLVDAVWEVLRLPRTAIEPPPPLLATIDASFITGVAKSGDRLVILLDLERILE